MIITYCDIAFKGHAPGCLKYLLKFISQHHTLIYNQTNPDIVLCNYFCSNAISPKIREQFPKSKIIFFTGENVRFNYDLCDLAIGFDSNGIYYPLWCLYTRGGRSLLRYDSDEISDYRHKDLFCGFVHRNINAKYRAEFVAKLSKYKQVTCAGNALNNFPQLGPTHEDKRNFIRRCKFFMCFENSQYCGYITEKLAQGFEGRAIPLYWGGSNVCKYFNKKSFLNRHDFNSDQEFIDKIIQIDNNDQLYLDMLNQPPLIGNKLPGLDQNLQNKLDFFFGQYLSKGFELIDINA